MRWFLRGFIPSAALGLFALLAAGCAQSNESYADIQGEAPAGATADQGYAQASQGMMGGSEALKSQGYPGGGRRKATSKK